MKTVSKLPLYISILILFSSNQQCLTCCRRHWAKWKAELMTILSCDVWTLGLYIPAVISPFISVSFLVDEELIPTEVFSLKEAALPMSLWMFLGTFFTSIVIISKVFPVEPFITLFFNKYYRNNMPSTFVRIGNKLNQQKDTRQATFLFRRGLKVIQILKRARLLGHSF